MGRFADGYQPGGVRGQAKLALNNGSFLPVSANATGPLRFISIFNLAGLVQRANVNQLFDPGLTFDKATGDLSLEGDRVVINKFAIRNGGGSLDLGGNFDIASEVIDAELTVTLPLVENIPWVAALAGGLPIAAGAYLASRVFEDQVTRLSSGVYSVTGPVNTPEVKFIRVFDARRSAEKMGEAATDQSISYCVGKRSQIAEQLPRGRGWQSLFLFINSTSTQLPQHLPISVGPNGKHLR